MMYANFSNNPPSLCCLYARLHGVVVKLQTKWKNNFPEFMATLTGAE